MSLRRVLYSNKSAEILSKRKMAHFNSSRFGRKRATHTWVLTQPDDAVDQEYTILSTTTKYAQQDIKHIKQHGALQSSIPP